MPRSTTETASRVPPAPERPTVAVIGSGFSGLLTAIHLLEADPRTVVRLVEKATPSRLVAFARRLRDRID